MAATPYVSRDASQSVPNTQANADILPLSSPHSKSSQPRFSSPYFFSIAAAASEARAKTSACPSCAKRKGPVALQATTEWTSIANGGQVTTAFRLLQALGALRLLRPNPIVGAGLG